MTGTRYYRNEKSSSDLSQDTTAHCHSSSSSFLYSIESIVNGTVASRPTQQLTHLNTENNFNISPGPLLFLPDTANQLYKTQALEKLAMKQ